MTQVRAWVFCRLASGGLLCSFFDGGLSVLGLAGQGSELFRLVAERHCSQHLER
jgi:hypothetical protein